MERIDPFVTQHEFAMHPLRFGYLYATNDEFANQFDADELSDNTDNPIETVMLQAMQEGERNPNLSSNAA